MKKFGNNVVYPSEKINISNNSYGETPVFGDTIERKLDTIMDSPDSPPFDKQLFTSNKVTPDISFNSSSSNASSKQSLDKLCANIKGIEDFICASEAFLRKERERDREFYARERRRKYGDKSKSNSNSKHTIDDVPQDVMSGGSSGDKENQTPDKKSDVTEANSPSLVRKPTYKIYSNRRKKSSPIQLHSRLYFRNGKIGCADAENVPSNIESTHELVKRIIKLEHEKPLVSAEHVNKVLSERYDYMQDYTTLLSNNNQSAIIDMPITDNIGLNFVPDETMVVGTPIEEAEIKIHNESMEKPNETVPRSVVAEVSELIKPPSASSLHSTESCQTLNPDVKDHVRHLVRRFTARTKKMRNRLDLPPTPSSSVSTPTPPLDSGKGQITEIQMKLKHEDAPMTSIALPDDNKKSKRSNLCGYFKWFYINRFFTGDGVLDPQGKFYISWLCVVSLSFVYNVWVIPLRSTFPFQTPANTKYWITLDICADVIYLCDVLFVKHRIMYLYEGFFVRDKRLTRSNYMRKLQFKMDVLALIPLDLLYFKYGTSAVFLRAPRLLKIQSFWEFFKLLDRVISSPHIVRVAKTLVYMLYMIHLTACAYYAYSAYQGLGTNRWVFSGKGHPYVRCFAFATKTATSIGKNPKPEKVGEFLFMTSAWLMGVFVFALLIGQIRDIIATATRSQSEYRQLMDETLEYMRRLNLPEDIQHRVKMWFKFTWEQQRTLDESQLLDYLPANLKTDIAIAVHIQTLSKVQLFADCDEALLRDLVLKLRSVIYLPGDFVCRKGEVGKEMYIVKLGQVQVMGGIHNDEVLATLSEGSVFGEISLLAINGVEGNRRTADVKSRGFANLFVLSKSDLNEALVYYPNAQAILKRRAGSLMRKNAEREREEAKRRIPIEPDVVIGNPTTPLSPPKLLKTVMEALPEESQAVVLLKQGSKKYKRLSKKRLRENSEENSTNKENVEDPSSAEVDASPASYKTQPLSSELLLSIENELDKRFRNLTDSEKARMNPNNSDNDAIKKLDDKNSDETA